MDSLAEAGSLRILAWSSAGGDWDWRRVVDREVRTGDRLAVVATRAGLARLLRASKGVVPSPPARLVEGAPGQRGKTS